MDAALEALRAAGELRRGLVADIIGSSSGYLRTWIQNGPSEIVMIAATEEESASVPRLAMF